MSPFVAELLGTMILILLGDGVVANVVLKKTKGHASGWIVITAGWALAVTFGIYAVGRYTGAHLNPAVTIALAATGSFAWAQVPVFIAAQMLGAILGAALVWLLHFDHWAETEEPGDKLACFCTGPAIRNLPINFVVEVVATAMLLFGILSIAGHNNGAGNVDLAKGLSTALAPIMVGSLVFSIGLSLGGTTGYALNPARDLGPRIAHAILPIAGKGSSDWGYALIPVLGPIVGGVVGAGLFKLLNG